MLDGSPSATSVERSTTTGRDEWRRGSDAGDEMGVTVSELGPEAPCEEGGRTGRRRLHMVVAVVVAWLLGLSGAVAGLRGWGPVVMDPIEQQQGLVRIVSLTFLWVLVWGSTRRVLPGALAVALIGCLLTCVPSTAANVGRAPALVATSGVFVAIAALVEWTGLRRATNDRPSPTWTAVVALCAGNAAWALGDRLLLAFAGLGAAIALAEAHRRGAAPIERLERTIRRSGRSILRHAGMARDRVVRDLRRVRSGAAAVAARSRTASASRSSVLSGPTVLGSLVILAVFAPVFWQLVANGPDVTFLGINDYGIHLSSVRAISLVPFNFDVPHFMFHATSAGIAWVATPTIGPVVTLCIAQLATFVGVVWLFRAPDTGHGSLSERRSVALGIWFLVMETPTLVLLVAGLVPETTRFMSVHALYSPTWVVGLPWAVAGVCIAERLIDGRPSDRPRVDLRWVLSAVVGVSAIAKPSFAICFIPGLALYLVVVRTPLRSLLATMWRVASPAALVVAWQTWYLTSGQSEVWVDHFVFRPIGGPVYGWGRAGWPFWLPLIWLVLAVWSTRGAVVREPLVRLVLCCTAVALPLFLLFQEEGPRAGHGNLGVPLQVCIFLLLLLSVRAIARTAATWWDSGRHAEVPRVPASLVASSVAAVAFLAGGLLALSDVLGLLRLPISWDPFF